MATETRKRTRQPCEGCHKPNSYSGFRFVGEVCGDCQQLLQEAQRAREEQKTRISTQRFLRVYQHEPKVVYWMEYPGGSRGPRERLGEAMTALLMEFAEPLAPGNQPPWGTELERAFPESPHREGEYTRLSIRTAAHDLLKELDSAIRATLIEAYQAGFRRGQALLQGLANGSMSVAEFEERSLNNGRQKER